MFKVGDLVRLRSGAGPKMTVLEVAEFPVRDSEGKATEQKGPATCLCCWFEDNSSECAGDIKTYRFAEEALRSEPAKKKSEPA